MLRLGIEDGHCGMKGVVWEGNCRVGYTCGIRLNNKLFPIVLVQLQVFNIFLSERVNATFRRDCAIGFKLAAEKRFDRLQVLSLFFKKIQNA